IFDTPGDTGVVRGLIRVMSFDASREMDSQDLSTLKLMGDHLSTRVGIFGDLSDHVTAEPTEAERFEFDSILIVHSDRLARRRFSRILRQKFNILEADNSEKALELLEDDNRVDLILLDAGLEDTFGLGFCKVIKDSEKWRRIPVVLVNADNTPAARVDGLNAGADDCIPDSCLEAELVARVNSSLRHLRTERDLSIQLELLEDYAQRLEKAQEKLKNDKQIQDQNYQKLQKMKQEADVLSNQESQLHRISNMIRSSFDIKGNLKEMLEALAGWWNLDCCFIVMPSDEEPEDTIRVECCSDKSYRVVDFDRDLETLRIFRENFDADEAVISNDVASDRRLVPFRKSAISGFQVKSLFYIPINYEQKLLGLLVGYKCQMKASWSRINENFYRSVSDQVATGVVNARLYAKVQRQATTDGLTGLFNHRTGQEKLAEQLKLAERYQRNISVIMLDVDHFKSINDNYGLPAGDSVLKSVSRLIKKNCRDVDIPVRYGGEEFLIVLPEIARDGAVVVAERIRTALENEIVNHEDIEINVTGSFGVASFPEDADQQQALLDLADKALYYSKRVSRNRVSTTKDLSFDKVNEDEDEQDRSSEEIAREFAEHDHFVAPEISAEARETEELVPEVVEMVKSLASTLYSKSDYNKQHHLEVARMSELLAKVMGLSAQQVEQIRVAGLLHDVGLLKLPKTVVDKEGTLSNEEREIVNQHPLLGAQLLKPVRALRDICEILEHHHERWDGTGFPSGMKGEEIPLPARIVAIVDSYHAMISDRPYREAMSHEEALQALQSGAGRQWDPFLVEIFTAVVKSMKTGGGAKLPAGQPAAPGSVSAPPSQPQP
ncbi:MAG TPA: diguanylate cyclase, partial [Candidatus Melainabacteria bacterium]|nr:diguanylate cyclase [Candidatus Melainabacteria bacterium]